MTLNTLNPNSVIHTPQGNEVEYRVVYEVEINGIDSPLLIDLGRLPNWQAGYRIRIEVEQIPKDTSA